MGGIWGGALTCAASQAFTAASSLNTACVCYNMHALMPQNTAQPLRQTGEVFRRSAELAKAHHSWACWLLSFLPKGKPHPGHAPPNHWRFCPNYTWTPGGPRVYKWERTLGGDFICTAVGEPLPMQGADLPVLLSGLPTHNPPPALHEQP